MPYIKQNEREELGAFGNPETPGQLNFLLTAACIIYLNGKKECYQTYNDIIGALECCKQEMYRRKISKYEDKKIKENGDVY
jgi:hypothetical protein